MERAEPRRVEQVAISELTQFTSIKLNWRAWNPQKAWFWKPFVRPPRIVFTSDVPAKTTAKDREAAKATMVRWLAVVESGLSGLGRAAEANEVAYRRAVLEESPWGAVVGDPIFGHSLRISNPATLLLAGSLLCMLMFRRYGVYYEQGDEISLKIAALPLKLQTAFLPTGFRKAGILRCWMLSIALITKLSFGTKYLTYQENCIVWAKVEWIVGLILMTAFTVCLIKNFPELNELLHGIIA
jgi:hypothetical protein